MGSMGTLTEELGSMHATHNPTVSTLSQLLGTCRKCRDWFFQAAESVCDTRLKSLFLRYGDERARFATELEWELRRLGGDIEANPSDGLLDFGQSVLARHAVDRILSECERKEDHALRSYFKALKADLPEDSYRLIERQYEAVKEAYDLICASD